MQIKNEFEKDKVIEELSKELLSGSPSDKKIVSVSFDIGSISFFLPDLMRYNNVPDYISGLANVCGYFLGYSNEKKRIVIDPFIVRNSFISPFLMLVENKNITNIEVLTFGEKNIGKIVTETPVVQAELTKPTQIELYDIKNNNGCIKTPQIEKVVGYLTPSGKEDYLWIYVLDRYEKSKLKIKIDVDFVFRDGKFKRQYYISNTKAKLKLAANPKKSIDLRIHN